MRADRGMRQTGIHLTMPGKHRQVPLHLGVCLFFSLLHIADGKRLLLSRQIPLKQRDLTVHLRDRFQTLLHEVGCPLGDLHIPQIHFCFASGELRLTEGRIALLHGPVVGEERLVVAGRDL